MELDDMESNDTTCGSVTAPPTHGVAHTETVVASDSLSPLPDPIPTCHIKQEPRVEVSLRSIKHVNRENNLRPISQKYGMVNYQCSFHFDWPKFEILQSGWKAHYF